MKNLCTFTGRITKDLNLKTSQTGKELLNFDLAVQRDYKNNDGEYDSDFISCIAFGKTAEFITNYAKKGYLMSVEGRMQNNNFTREDGTTNYGMQLIVKSVDSSVLFLNKNEDKQTSQQQNNGYQNNYNQYNQQQRGQVQPKQNGWQQQQQQNSPFANANGPIDINDDDLPF
ncbi:single-stranded DNA-binding protein [Mammaliicoccus sciuri]|uniref:single-stranded DNA-binding protein n=1 Tax=Mammaliicoccus sciuri TaxID=1296 RepID=UPI001D0D648C|nr:single-stranded DNA-binding protein [Mammaliicoccus sciuri]MCC2087932.1 single-stranded DNA-binding protein [Mammaliicoccus sciuri]